MARVRVTYRKIYICSGGSREIARGKEKMLRVQCRERRENMMEMTQKLETTLNRIRKAESRKCVGWKRKVVQ